MVGGQWSVVGLARNFMLEHRARAGQCTALGKVGVLWPLLLLVGVMKIEPGLDVPPLREAALSFFFLQRLAAPVAPAIFDNESIPNLDLL